MRIVVVLTSSGRRAVLDTTPLLIYPLSSPADLCLHDQDSRVIALTAQVFHYGTSSRRLRSRAIDHSDCLFSLSLDGSIFLSYSKSKSGITPKTSFPRIRGYPSRPKSCLLCILVRKSW
jgi:hypothetical protein